MQPTSMRHARARSGRLLRCLLAAALSIGAATMSAPAIADDDRRIAELSSTLSEPRSSDKERISAVTALGRLGDKRALRPLVSALHDTSPTVRAIAAAALGKLGHRAALPALREASSDRDTLVRKRAEDAIAAIHTANGLPQPGAAPAGAQQVKAGFGAQPRAVAARPDLYVVVKSTSDDSPGRLDRKARKSHADIVRSAMMTSLRGEPTVTSVASDADRYGLDQRQLDLSIVKLEQRVVGSYIEIEAQLRLAVSDRRGKMESFLSGGAKVQVPRRSFNASYLPQVRREALENAVRGIFDKLLRHLRTSPTA